MTPKRTCKKCLTDKPLTAEHFRPFEKNGKEYFRHQCHECASKRGKELYKQNYERIRNQQTEHYKAQVLSRRAQQREKARGRREWFYRTVVFNESCKHCGESDPIVLEFHHRHAEEKSHSVSGMIESHSKEKILAEVAKCDVLCANCHRRVTAKERNWQILKYL